MSLLVAIKLFVYDATDQKVENISEDWISLLLRIWIATQMG